jgi:hypothetical protein
MQPQPDRAEEAKEQTEKSIDAEIEARNSRLETFNMTATRPPCTPTCRGLRRSTRIREALLAT